MPKHLHPITTLLLILFFLTACDKDEPDTPDGETPTVQAASTYAVSVSEDAVYAEGLAHSTSSTFPASIPLLLDIYQPDNELANRPAFLFIHGGGFQGGTKTKPEIVAMADHFASRGWVFASVDYRTTEEMGAIAGMSPEEVVAYYQGIAPSEWVNHSLENAASSQDVQTSAAMYAAQRDVKSALRWLVSQADTYNINPDFITVGGASAGAITAVTLGISNQEDFRDEITTAFDPTLSTTNPNESVTVQNLVHFWGSNVKLDLFEAVYGLGRYDAADPELLMIHGTGYDPVTPFSEAEELQAIYDSLGVYSQLIPLEGAGHGAWSATVDGKNLFELTFDFLAERQGLSIE